jgi:hypothetical protein
LPLRRRAAHEYPGPSCPHCGADLDLERLTAGAARCRSCHREFEAVRFTPPERDAGVKRLADAGPVAETACAQHPLNATETNCQRCGVMMCGLCRIDADERVLCPACFDRLAAEGALASTRTTFRDYGRQASTLALAGLLFFWAGILFGPAVIYCSVRSLKQLREMGEVGGRLRSVLALVVGLAETGFGAFILWSMVPS